MPSSARTLCIPPDCVGQVWPHVEPMLRSATEKCGDWSIEGVRSLLDDGGLVWVTAEGPEILAATVTRLYRAPAGLVCQVVACGGGNANWSEQLQTIEAYAKAEGCSMMRIAGRKGWERVLDGYSVRYVILERAL